MTVTITITDPTATEATALRAYLTALHGGTATGGVATSTETYLVGERPSEQTVPVVFGASIIDPVKYPISEEGTTAEDAGAPDFDSAGMPWDERIHASSRATVADGTWRKKRGVSDELVAEVEAELVVTRPEGQKINLETGESWVEAPEVPEAPLPEPVPTPDAESPLQPVAASAPAEGAPPPPPASTANPFLAVMSRIGKSKIDKAKKDDLLKAAGALDEQGAPSILVLNKRPELIDGFIALLDSEGV